MPILRLKFRMTDLGLTLLGPKELTNPRALRRAKGFAGRRSKSFVSRAGSLFVSADDVHSLYYWEGLGYGGVGTTFKRLFGPPAVLKTALTGDRLTFNAMPPTSGRRDQLFVAGGGGTGLFKLNFVGTITNWGIAPPLLDPIGATGAAGNLKGAYKYWYTYYSTDTGTESNPNPIAMLLTLDNQQANLSQITVSPDTQVLARRIYRTVGNGTVGFLVATIPDNVTTVYTDNIADIALLPDELLFDNLNPRDVGFDFRECVSVSHLGRMWWTRDAVVGHGGRIYYSPAGRAEAVQGFIEPASNDDAMQRIIAWNGSLYGFTKNRIIEVVGFDEPFTYRDVTGAIGTDHLWTLVPTPYGILYRNRDDEFRKFDGVRSMALEPGALGDVLKGQALEGFASGFQGQYAGFGNDEYWVGDGAGITLALFLAADPPTWRELGGLGIKSMITIPDGRIAVSAGGKVLLFDSLALVTDDGAPIPFEIEVASLFTDPVGQAVIQRLMIEANTGSQAIVPTLVLGDGNVALAKVARIAGIRLSHAGLTAQVEVFGIDVDVYFPEQKRVPIEQSKF
jgi:hypothetical protein